MKKLLTAVTVALACITGTASAQTYFGLGAGRAKTDTNKTSWNVYGGYQFNPVFGIEAGYMDLGQYRGSDVESWSLAGTASLPLGSAWSLFGKLGASANRTHFSGSAHHTDVLVGAGASYAMNRNWGIRLEYDDFGKLSNTSSGDNSRGRNLGLSLKYSY